MKVQTYFRSDLAIVVPDDDPGHPIRQYGDILYEVINTDSETSVECAKTGTRGTLALLQQAYPRTNFHLKRPLAAVSNDSGRVVHSSHPIHWSHPQCVPQPLRRHAMSSSPCCANRSTICRRPISL